MVLGTVQAVQLHTQLYICAFFLYYWWSNKAIVQTSQAADVLFIRRSAKSILIVRETITRWSESDHAINIDSACHVLQRRIIWTLKSIHLIAEGNHVMTTRSQRRRGKPYTASQHFAEGTVVFWGKERSNRVSSWTKRAKYDTFNAPSYLFRQKLEQKKI